MSRIGFHKGNRDAAPDIGVFLEDSAICGRRKIATRELLRTVGDSPQLPPRALENGGRAEFSRLWEKSRAVITTAPRYSIVSRWYRRARRLARASPLPRLNGAHDVHTD